MTTEFNSIPWAIPTDKETTIKAIKALRRNTMIRKNNKSIPRLMIAKGMTLI